ncbi:MAG: hypothetical protein AAFP90_08485, partial [Planctomycetota bacterium]
MPPIFSALTPFFESLFWISLQSSIVLILAMGVARFLAPDSAAVRIRCLAAGLMGCLILLAPVAVPGLRVSWFPQQHGVAKGATLTTQNRGDTGLANDTVHRSTNKAYSNSQFDADPSFTSTSLQRSWSAANQWLAGIAAMLPMKSRAPGSIWNRCLPLIAIVWSVAVLLATARLALGVWLLGRMKRNKDITQHDAIRGALQRLDQDATPIRPRIIESD